MRKPMLQAIVMGAVTVAGFWITQHGLEMPNLPNVSAKRQPGWAWELIGFAVIAVGALLALRAGIIAWMRKELIDNREAVARWTVTPADWAALTGKPAPSSDMLVVIDTGAVVVGDSCTPIPARFNLLTYLNLSSIDWVEMGEGMGGLLVFSRMFWSYRESHIRFTRVPVPEAARGEAQAAIDAIDPLISDVNRERAERLFPSELSAARSGDPDAANWLLARSLLTWGGGLAAIGAIGWLVSTLPPRAGEVSSAAFWEPAGITAFAVGMVLVGISFFMSR